MFALGVVRVAGQPDVISCEDVIVDFSTAVVSEGVITDSVTVDGAIVDITVVAKLPDSSPTEANIYNTSAGTGIDPDLDVADEGNAAIVQKIGAPVPNDRSMGGILLFNLTSADATGIFLESIKILDIEVNTSVRILNAHARTSLRRRRLPSLIRRATWQPSLLWAAPTATSKTSFLWIACKCRA